MSSPLRPIHTLSTSADHSDPHRANPLLRFPGEARSADRQLPTLMAGERVAVSSAITGGIESGARRAILRPTLLVLLIILAGIGAATIVRLVAGAAAG